MEIVNGHGLAQRSYPERVCRLESNNHQGTIERPTSPYRDRSIPFAISRFIGPVFSTDASNIAKSESKRDCCAFLYTQLVSISLAQGNSHLWALARRTRPQCTKLRVHSVTWPYRRFLAAVQPGYLAQCLPIPDSNN
jgi:hypothetical protein